MQLLSTKLIWDKGRHSAFTDLCEYQKQYFCCFRQASGHISREGIIQVLVSDDLKHWRLASTVRQHGLDLRDPKLSVDPQGNLCLLYAQVTRSKKTPGPLRSMYSKSKNGITWSTGRQIAQDNHWLWRVNWQQKQALGISYGEGKAMLYRGIPDSTFECVDPELFTKEKYGKGYPNESDIVFLNDNSAVCILRRDADSSSAQLGRSRFPYTQWQWHDLGQYVGGPALLSHNSKIILAGRSFTPEQGCRTSLWTVDLASNKIHKQLDLPSAGDTSYPGMVIKNNSLFVSYYSEHQQGKSCIYLAEIELNQT